jgi:nucleotide-binding universal stress UspA family protein
VFKRILVACDGSEAACKAVRLAAGIAAKDNAGLHLLHVVPEGPIPRGLERMLDSEHLAGAKGGDRAPPPAGQVPAEVQVWMRDQLRRDELNTALHQLGKRILDEAERIALEAGAGSVSREIADGDPVETILEHAKTHQIDLIAVGSRGLGNLKGMLLGSVSSRVSQLCQCSCITVK